MAMDDFSEILQLSIQALHERIEEELQANPVLELGEVSDVTGGNPSGHSELQANPVLELEDSDASVGTVAAPLAIPQLPIEALFEEEWLMGLIWGGCLNFPESSPTSPLERKESAEREELAAISVDC